MDQRAVNPDRRHTFSTAVSLARRNQQLRQWFRAAFMDRDRPEVIGSDAMRRRRQRVAAVLVCAGLMIVAIWAARVRPGSPVDTTVDAAVGGVGETQIGPAKTGSAPQVNDARAKPPKPLPGLDSSLSPVPKRLHLVSTSPGRNAREGTARLGVSRENPQTYVAGAVLVNGARLAEIHKDRVMLEHRGKRTTLYVGISGDSAVEGTQDLAMVGGSATESPGSRPSSAADPLVDVVRAMPFYENEVLAGVQVFAGQKASRFSALGLQSRDVIIAIDGSPVFDAGVAVERLRTLTSGAALTVIVRRGEETKQLSLDGAALAKASAQPTPLP